MATRRLIKGSQKQSRQISNPSAQVSANPPMWTTGVSNVGTTYTPPPNVGFPPSNVDILESSVNNLEQRIVNLEDKFESLFERFALIEDHWSSVYELVEDVKNFHGEMVELSAELKKEISDYRGKPYIDNTPYEAVYQDDDIPF
jgi:hypothetical protein